MDVFDLKRLFPTCMCALCAAIFSISTFRPAPVHACNACKDAKEIPCKAHRPPTAFKFLHSLWLDYKCCLGTGRKPCPKCSAEGEKADEYEKFRKRLEEWVVARRTDFDLVLFGDEPKLASELDANPVRHCESDNFRFSGNFRPLPVSHCDVPEGLFPDLPDKKVLKKQFSAEHYDWILLKRAEDAFKAFKAVFQDQGRFRSASTNYYKDIFKAAEGKYDVFLWHRGDHHQVCGRKFFGVAHEMGVYKHGARITAVVGGNEYTGTDENLDRYLTHMLNHLFVEAYDFEIGYDFPAWIPEGFAHYMEWKKFGDFKITCFFEKTDPVSIPSKASAYVLTLVTSNQHLPAASVIKMNYNSMDQKAHCEMWSFMHYLIEGAPRENFIKFMRELKRTRDQMASFKTAYGYSIIQMDEPWKEFVLKNYK